MGVSRFYLLFVLSLLLFSLASAEINKKSFTGKGEELTKEIPEFGEGFSVLAVSQDQYEYDDDPSLATSIQTNGASQTHTFHSGTDVDWIKFECTQNESYNISVSDLNIYIQVYIPDGSSLSLDSFNYYYDGSSYNIKSSKVVFYCSENSTIYVKLEYKYYATATYTVSVINTSVPASERDNYYFNASSISTDGTEVLKSFSFFSNDKDYFKFDATAGSIYVLETNNASANVDTYLTLFDTDGKTIIKENDDASIYLNSRIVWKCPSDDTYYVRVWDRYGRGGNYNVKIYSPTITALQTDGTQVSDSFSVGGADYFSFSATAGNRYVIKTANTSASTDTYLKVYNSTFDLIQYNDDTYYTGLQDNNSLTTMYATNTDTYYIEVSDYYIVGGSYNISVDLNVPTKYNDNFEVDDDFTLSNSISVDGTPQTHSFYYYGESDFINFSAVAGNTYRIKTDNIGGRIVDTYLVLYDSSHKLIDYNDDVGSDCSLTNIDDCLSEIDFTPDTSGVYYLRVWDISSAGNNYTLSVEQNGTITTTLVTPSTDVNVTKNGLFEFTVNVSCSGGSCGDVSVYLDPKYSDKVVEKKVYASKELPTTSGRYIIILKNPSAGISASSLSSDVKSLQKEFLSSSPDIKVLRQFSTFPLISAELSEAQLIELKNNPYILDIVPDRVFHATLDESVPQIRANDTWDVQYANTNVTGLYQTVCIIDSGVNYSHPALVHAYVGGYDFVDNDNDPMDEFGHGTHVAGIIVSNNTTYRGVAYDAGFVAIRSLNSSGSGYESDILAGIDWCINHSSQYNISVISMSLGTEGVGWSDTASCEQDNKAWIEPIQTAIANGIAVVAASGNDGFSDKINAPACLGDVISVGAVDKSDKVTSYSNAASFLDLLAPGGNETSRIFSTCKNGSFFGMWGTSMATPHVAGAILLLNQYEKLLLGRNLNPDEALNYLKSSGKSILDSRNGLSFPRVDVLAAVELMNGTKDLVPMDSGTPFFTTTHPQYTNTSQNPATNSCLRDMKDGDSCLVTWVVNATGVEDTTWEFYVESKGDFAGSELNSTSSKINITITTDNVAPTINILSPLSNQIFGAGSIPIKISSTCPTSLVSQVSFKLFNSTGGLVKSGNLAKVIGTPYWNTSFDATNLASGSYTLNVTSVNSLGKLSYATRAIVIDGISPNVTIHTSYPQNSSTPYFNFTATDDHNLSYVWYKLNGVDVAKYSTSGTSFSKNDTLNLNYPGWNYIKIYVNDSSNNTISHVKEFYEISKMNATKWADEHNATVSSSGDAVWNNQTFNISLNTTNFNVTLYGVNGEHVWWDYDFSFEENNTALNSITEDYGLTPYMNLYLDENLVKDTICDGTNCENLTNNDYAEITFSPNSTGYYAVYSCGRGIPSDFSSCEKLNECNSTNNMNCYNDTQTKTIVYVSRFSTLVVVKDTTPPNIVINSPEDKAYDISSGILVNVSSSPDTVECNYSIDGGANNSLSKNGDYFTSTFGPIKNGNHDLTAYCRDGAGNLGSSNVDFTIYDTDAPSVSSVITGTSKTAVEIDWTTNEPSDGKVTLYSGSVCGDDKTYKTSNTMSQAHSLTFEDLSPATDYSFKITSTDYQGNEGTSTCYTFTTDPLESQSDEGGGGGGGNGTTQTVREIFFWSTIPQGESIIADVKSEYIPVDSLEVYLSSEMINAKLEVESYENNPPPGVPEAPANIIYKYFGISTNFNQYISWIKIKIKIPTSWFTSNNYDPNNVSLYHYDYLSGKWNEEGITYLGESNGYYLYSSIVNSLSPFAISAAELEVKEYCGNGICNQSAGENCSTCEVDCGLCLSKLIKNETESNYTASTNIESPNTNVGVSYFMFALIGVVIGIVGFFIIRFKALSNIGKPKKKRKRR